MMDTGAEIAEKTDRVARLLRDRGLGGVLLGTRPNFAWITGGKENGVDVSREAGVAAVMVGADGRRWLLANAIEMPRMLQEELAGQDLIPVDFPWTEEQESAERIAERARQALGTPAPLAADHVMDGLPMLDREIARARYRLTPAETARYRDLGRDAGAVLGEVCRELRPGLPETEIARLTATALAARGMAAVVLLVGSGDRLARFRHPLPTDAIWERGGAMVVVCARRAGLIAALTRIVWAGPVPEEIRRRTRAAAEVDARLLAATRPGAVGRDLFEAAVRAYAGLGFPGEERLHHQGGACGYLSRDWIAHPRCDEVVEPGQAFAWNPSITGTKVEETWIVSESSVEAVTRSPGWPVVEIEAGGNVYASPDVASLEEI